MRTFLLLAASVYLLSPVTAADREAEAQKRKQLMELAAEKQKAMILSSEDIRPKTEADVHMSIGFFIDGEGMAVMSLVPFLGPKPFTFDCGGKALKKPRLLHVDAAHMIAVVKFDHQPEVWIEPRREALVSRKDWAAMLIPPGGRPALVGPVWGRFKLYNLEARKPVLCAEMQLMTGRPAGPSVVGEGCPVIDEEGRLCGVFGSIAAGEHGRGVNLSPTAEWIQAIDKAREAKEAIAYPLKGEDNPKDPADLLAASRMAIGALHERKFELSMAEVEKALKELPDSMQLKRMRIMIVQVALQHGKLPERRKDLVSFCEALDPGPDAGAEERAMYIYKLGVGHRLSGDIEKATDCLRQAAQLAPNELPALQFEMSRIHHEAGRLDEAIASLMLAAKAQPGSLTYLNPLTKLLGQAGRWEEEQKFTDDIYEIERLTQPVSR